MNLELTHISFDCDDAAALAGFWSAATGMPLVDGATAEFACIGHGDHTWLFAQVPEAKTAKNRVHIDLASEDRDADVARLTELGARALAEHEYEGLRWTVMVDPAGNEFCVV